MHRLIQIAAGMLLLATSAAQAISIEPGQWDMTFTMSMPMLSEPLRSQSFQECVTESEFEPDDIDMGDDSNCQITNVEDGDDSLEWSIECDGPAGVSKGTWTFTSHGDSLEGHGNMSAPAGGQTMEMTMEWSGERTGDCAE